MLTFPDEPFPSILPLRRLARICPILKGPKGRHSSQIFPALPARGHARAEDEKSFDGVIPGAT